MVVIVKISLDVSLLRKGHWILKGLFFHHESVIKSLRMQNKILLDSLHELARGYEDTESEIEKSKSTGSVIHQATDD
jgi:hypothetical protein